MTSTTWHSDSEIAFLNALEEVALYVGAMVVLIGGAAALLFIGYTLPTADNGAMGLAMAGYFTAVLGTASIVTRHGL